MKIVFYRTLISRAKNISPSEKILYSFLVSKSITNYGEFFEQQSGKICKEAVLTCLCSEGNKIELVEINHSKIARELGVSRPSVISGLRKLENSRYITTDENGNKFIYVNKELLEHGYFELLNQDVLTGDLLIFYSYLVAKSREYGYCIDTYKYKLAEEFGKTQIAITKLLNRLYKVGLASRLPNGKLLINTNKTLSQ